MTEYEVQRRFYDEQNKLKDSGVNFRVRSISYLQFSQC